MIMQTFLINMKDILLKRKIHVPASIKRKAYYREDPRTKKRMIPTGKTSMGKPIYYAQSTVKNIEERQKGKAEQSFKEEEMVANIEKMNVKNISSDDLIKIKKNKELLGRFIEANKNYIYDSMKDFISRVRDAAVESEDLYQEATQGVTYAINKYDPKHGVAGFRQYMRHAIRGAVSVAVKKKIDALSLEKMVAETGDIGLMQATSFGQTSTSETEKNLQNLFISGIRKKLEGKREKQIFDMLAQGAKQKEIAKKLKIAPSYVTKIKQNVIKPMWQRYFKSKEFTEVIIDFMKSIGEDINVDEFVKSLEEKTNE